MSPPPRPARLNPRTMRAVLRSLFAERRRLLCGHKDMAKTPSQLQRNRTRILIIYIILHDNTK
jgi:hypothetical protein